MNETIDFSNGEFVHLGLGGTAVPLPVHTGEMDWYEEYGRNHGSDGIEGRLVSMHTFSESWDSWEVHPKGSELVLCVSGEVTLIQEFPDGETATTELGAGQAVVNEPGVWHTADVAEGTSTTVVFITAGEGTQHRAR